MTKSKTLARRKYWRERKAESRAKASRQKQRRVKEYDRFRKQDTTDEEIESEVETKGCVQSPAAVRKMRSRMKGLLPKDSKAATTAIIGLLNHASPRKKKLLANKYCSGRDLAAKNEAVNMIRQRLIQKRGKKSNVFRSLFKHRFTHQTTAATLFGVSYNWLSMASQLKEEGVDSQRKVYEDTAKQFYFTQEVSTTLPHPQKCTKQGPRFILNQNIEKTYKCYNEKHPDGLKRSKFFSMRPKNVKSSMSNKWVQSVCPKCANIEMMIKCLHKFFSLTSKGKDVKNKYDIYNTLLCPRADHNQFNDLKCIESECSSCGPEKLINNLILLTPEDQNKMVTWTKWELVSDVDTTKPKKMGITSKSMSGEEFLDAFKKILPEFLKHIFIATWQYRQFSEAKKNLDNKSLLTIVDFGENYRHQYQDEVSAMHWTYEQSTIHPVVCFYKSDSNDNELIQEDVIIISKDKLHDNQAGELYERLAVEKVQSSMIQPIAKSIRWSDTCKAQYRSKHTFHHLSTEGKETSHNYFGPHHGKGPADGALACVKYATTNAIKARQTIIRNSIEWFNWCTANLQVDKKLYKRSFIYVESVPRVQREECVPIKGTNSIQCARNKGMTGIIECRNLSCFCKSCYVNDANSESCECLNKPWVSAWEEKPTQKILQEHTVKIRKTKSNLTEREETTSPVRKTRKRTEKAECKSKKATETEETASPVRKTRKRTEKAECKSKKTTETEETVSPVRKLRKRTEKAECKSKKTKETEETASPVRKTRKRTEKEECKSKKATETEEIRSPVRKTRKRTEKEECKSKKTETEETTLPQRKTKKETKKEECKIQKSTSHVRKTTNPSNLTETEDGKAKQQRILYESLRRLPPNYKSYNYIEPVLAQEENLLLDYVRADGNCFYRGVSKCMYGCESKFKYVRKCVCDVMSDRKDLFTPYIDGVFEIHLRKQRRDKEWATTAEIYAASYWLQRNIFIWTPVDTEKEDAPYHWNLFKPPAVSNEKPSHHPFAICECHLSLVNTDGNHYDRAMVVDGGCNCQISAPVLSGVEVFHGEAIEENTEVGGQEKFGTNEASEISSVHEKASEIGSSVHETEITEITTEGEETSEIESSVHEKASEIGSSVHEKASEISSRVHEKASEISSSVHEKASEITM